MYMSLTHIGVGWLEGSSCVLKSAGGGNKICDAILAQDLGDPHLFLFFVLRNLVYI